MEALSRLVCENELLVDDHVDALSSEWLAAKVNHHVDFTIDLMALRHQVSFQRQRVDVFPKTKTELPVDVVKAADNRMSQALLEKPALGMRSHLSKSVVS